MHLKTSQFVSRNLLLYVCNRHSFKVIDVQSLKHFLKVDTSRVCNFQNFLISTKVLNVWNVWSKCRLPTSHEILSEIHACFTISHYQRKGRPHFFLSTRDLLLQACLKVKLFCRIQKSAKLDDFPMFEQDMFLDSWLNF